jgi:hypothetical protein
MAKRDTRPMGSIGKLGLDDGKKFNGPQFGILPEDDQEQSGLTGVNKGIGTVPLSPIAGPTAKGIPSLTDADLGQTRRPFDSTITGIPRGDLPFTGTIQGRPAQAIVQFPQPTVELKNLKEEVDFGDTTTLGRQVDELILRQTETGTADASPVPIIELIKPKALEVLTETPLTSDLPSQLQAAMLRISELEEDLKVAKKRHADQLVEILKLNQNIIDEKTISTSLREVVKNLQESNLEKEQEFEREIEVLNKKITELLKKLSEANTKTNLTSTTLPEPLQKGPNDLVRISKLPKPLQWLVKWFV